MWLVSGDEHLGRCLTFQIHFEDFGGFEFTRLDELFAATGQVGVRGIAFNDGELLNTAACKVIKLAAS